MTEQAAVDERVTTMQCLPPNELRALRDAHELAKWSWLGHVAELSRTFARVTALPAFLVTLAGFLYYPRPWGSHWSTRKTIAVEIVSTGGIACFVSILFCFAAWGLNEWSKSARLRPLWPATVQNLASLAMFVLTPAF